MSFFIFLEEEGEKGGIRRRSESSKECGLGAEDGEEAEEDASETVISPTSPPLTVIVPFVVSIEPTEPLLTVIDSKPAALLVAALLILLMLPPSITILLPLL